jgi:hypothetical protein
VTPVADAASHGPSAGHGDYWAPSGFEYAQARLQAQFGRRPSADDWQRLDAARDAVALMEMLRTTPMAPWAANLSAASDVHDIEHSMRGSFTAAVARTAGWVPVPWRAAVLWVSWLPYLPAFQYLLEGGPTLAWMREGHRLRPFALEDPAARRAALIGHGHGWAVTARDSGQALLPAWLSQWRARLPSCSSETLRSLQALAALLEAQAQRPRLLPAVTAEPGRDALQRQLRRIFRRQAVQPGAVFAYLGLLALDLERLRGALVLRSLFPPAPEAGPALGAASTNARTPPRTPGSSSR